MNAPELSAEERLVVEGFGIHNDDEDAEKAWQVTVSSLEDLRMSPGEVEMFKAGRASQQQRIRDLEAERDEWRRKFTDCHPIHLKGVLEADELRKERDRLQEHLVEACLGTLYALAAAPSSTLAEVKAQALEAFKAVVRGEGEPRHGGEWVSVNHVEDLLDECAAEYREDTDHE